MAYLTANTLFHFTTKDALLGILRTGFRPSYREELGVSLHENAPELLVPMVCFCDLPLSKLDRHINGYEWEYHSTIHTSKKYGQYGLGMTKEWGRRRKLNPVNYIVQESYLLEFLSEIDRDIRQLCDLSQDVWDSSPVDPGIKSYYNNPIKRMMSIGSPPEPLEHRTLMLAIHALSNLAALFGYVKPLTDNNTGQLYYDEREWRLIVPYTRNYDGTVPIFFKKDDKLIPIGQHQYYEMPETDLDKYKHNVANKYMLTFNPEDIKYIILKDDTEIHEIIQCMESMPDRYNKEVIEKLVTRIITCQQIKEDF